MAGVGKERVTVRGALDWEGRCQVAAGRVGERVEGE